jgi:hypothetical protein
MTTSRSRNNEAAAGDVLAAALVYAEQVAPRVKLQTGEWTSDARRALVQGYAEGMKHGYELACREIAEQAQ